MKILIAGIVLILCSTSVMSKPITNVCSNNSSALGKIKTHHIDDQKILSGKDMIAVVEVAKNKESQCSSTACWTKIINSKNK